MTATRLGAEIAARSPNIGVQNVPIRFALIAARRTVVAHLPTRLVLDVAQKTGRAFLRGDFAGGYDRDEFKGRGNHGRAVIVQPVPAEAKTGTPVEQVSRPGQRVTDVFLARYAGTDAEGFTGRISAFFVSEAFRLVRDQMWVVEDVRRMLDGGTHDHFLIIVQQVFAGYVSLGVGNEPTFEMVIDKRFRITGICYSCLLFLASLKFSEGVRKFRTRIHLHNDRSWCSAEKAGWRRSGVCDRGMMLSDHHGGEDPWLDYELDIENVLNQPTAKKWLRNSKSRVRLREWGDPSSKRTFACNRKTLVAEEPCNHLDRENKGAV